MGPGGVDRHRNEKQEKAKAGGESNPVGADRFLGEQCYLCVFLSLHTLSSTHAHTQAMLWRELTNLFGEVHVSKTFTLQAQRLQRQHSRLTKKPSHPEIETRSNSEYQSVCLCWLWHLDVGLFTFSTAWGHVARNTVNPRRL